MKPKRSLDDPHVIRRFVIAQTVVCVLVLALGVLTHDAHHAHLPWEKWPGFHAAFGFITFAGLVLTGKHLRKLLMRPEDYYDD